MNGANATTLDLVAAGLHIDFMARRNGALLLVINRQTGSEFVVEAFAASVQIRQAVRFGCDDLDEAAVVRLLRLCAAMNARFSGTKRYIDRWHVLLTTADIVAEALTPAVIDVALRQVEFVSLAMLDLGIIVVDEARLPTDAEIGIALHVPALH